MIELRVVAGALQYRQRQPLYEIGPGEWGPRVNVPTVEKEKKV